MQTLYCNRCTSFQTTSEDMPVETGDLHEMTRVFSMIFKIFAPTFEFFCGCRKAIDQSIFQLNNVLQIACGGDIQATKVWFLICFEMLCTQFTIIVKIFFTFVHYVLVTAVIYLFFCSRTVQHNENSLQALYKIVAKLL